MSIVSSIFANISAQYIDFLERILSAPKHKYLTVTYAYGTAFTMGAKNDESLMKYLISIHASFTTTTASQLHMLPVPLVPTMSTWMISNWLLASHMMLTLCQCLILYLPCSSTVLMVYLAVTVPLMSRKLTSSFSSIMIIFYWRLSRPPPNSVVLKMSLDESVQQEIYVQWSSLALGRCYHQFLIVGTLPWWYYIRWTNCWHQDPTQEETV